MAKAKKLSKKIRQSRIKRNDRIQYRKQMKKAEQHLENNTNKDSQRATAKKFGVAFSTLQARAKGKHQETAGRPTAFSKHEETILADSIKYLAACGYGLTVDRVRLLAQEYSIQLGMIKWTIKPSSNKWVDSFRARVDVRLRKATNMPVQRANHMKIVIIFVFISPL